jgi:hypothetical protein
MAAERAVIEIELVPDLVVNGLRNADGAGSGECFEPVIRAVPRNLRGKLEPAEIFHEVLEHRWYRSDQRGRDVGLTEATDDYVRGVLVHKPDEAAVVGVDTQEMPVIAED